MADDGLGGERQVLDLLPDLVQTTVQVLLPAVLAASALVMIVSTRPTGTLLDQLKDR